VEDGIATKSQTFRKIEACICDLPAQEEHHCWIWHSGAVDQKYSECGKESKDLEKV